MEKDILVLTPTLGNRETLQKTIETVSKVGGERVKHIIVCPEERIESIKQKYGDIDCLPEKPGKKGIYAALNHGFRTYAKRYKYITFINDDDYWLNSFSLLISALDKDETLDMVYGKTCYVNENMQIIGKQTCSSQFNQFVTLLRHGIVLLTQQATLIKSDLFFMIGGFDESYKLAADTKFWAEVSLAGIKYKYIDAECAAYMIQDNQLSSDHETQNKEHSRLFTEIQNFQDEDRLAVVKYRFQNLPIYFRRALLGKIKNPFIK